MNGIYSCFNDPDTPVILEYAKEWVMEYLGLAKPYMDERVPIPALLTEGLQARLEGLINLINDDPRKAPIDWGLKFKSEIELRDANLKNWGRVLRSIYLPSKYIYQATKKSKEDIL